MSDTENVVNTTSVELTKSESHFILRSLDDFYYSKLFAFKKRFEYVSPSNFIGNLESYEYDIGQLLQLAELVEKVRSLYFSAFPVESDSCNFEESDF